MGLQLILADSTEVNIIEAGYAKHFVGIYEDSDAFKEIWDQMTDENLSEVAIVENGTIIQTIMGMHLEGTQTVENTDGTITGHFYMKGGEYAEDEYSEAGRILLGEEE